MLSIIFHSRSLISILLGIFILSCSNNTVKVPDELILVSINDTITISNAEFIKRANCAAGQVYCMNNTDADKRNILNSLIAEKILLLRPDA